MAAHCLLHSEDVPEAAKANFQNVPDSMFTLFVLMNGEELLLDTLPVVFLRVHLLQEWPDVMPLLDARGPQ